MNRALHDLANVAVVVLSPLDRLRCLCLKALGAPAKLLVRNRDLRVTVAGCGVVGVSLAATLFSPFWLLALGPVLLGTPHLVADLRYLGRVNVNLAFLHPSATGDHAPDPRAL